MIVKTLYLPGFLHLLSGSQAAGAETGEGDQRPRRLGGVGWPLCSAGDFQSRRGPTPARVYTPWVTFTCFSGTGAQPGKCLAGRLRCGGYKRGRAPATSRFPTRTRAPIAKRPRVCRRSRRFRAAHEELGGWFEKHKGNLWCGRSVMRSTGPTLMPDNAPENWRRWPYAGNQRPGCGFPTAQWVGLFCLATGRLWAASLMTRGARTRSCSPGS